VEEAPTCPIAPNSIYLVDSGGQYLDGTTDITRTVWVGPASADSRTQGPLYPRAERPHRARHGGVSCKGTVGGQLDTIWRAMPCGKAEWITPTAPATASAASSRSTKGRSGSPRRQGGQAGTGQELLAGMILSNEPGYYKAGEFGIRIENLVLVERREIAGAEGEYLGFENLTWAPIDQTLVDTALLTKAELQWWDDYHARVWAFWPRSWKAQRWSGWKRRVSHCREGEAARTWMLTRLT
jgi:Xaa-Pro aminopeptidase